MDSVATTPKVARWKLWGVGVRMLFLQGLLHKKGMQNLGLMWVLAPALQDLRVKGDDSLLSKHLAFFNCNPNFAPLIAGGLLRLEEQRLEGRAVSDDDLLRFKRSLSSPLAAMGDMLFLGGLKPLALTLACVFAIYKSPIGLVAIWLLYNLLIVSCRMWGVFYGYSKGWDLVEVFSGPTFQRVLGVVQSVGACAGGLLVAVVLVGFQSSGPWIVGLGISLIAVAVVLLRRDASSSRLAIALFPLAVAVAIALG